MTRMVEKPGPMWDLWRSGRSTRQSGVSPAGERRLEEGYGGHFNREAEEEMENLSSPRSWL